MVNSIQDHDHPHSYQQFQALAKEAHQKPLERIGFSLYDEANTWVPKVWSHFLPPLGLVSCHWLCITAYVVYLSPNEAFFLILHWVHFSVGWASPILMLFYTPIISITSHRSAPGARDVTLTGLVKMDATEFSDGGDVLFSAQT